MRPGLARTVAALLLGAGTVPAVAAPASTDGWQLDRVVVVMRHGVRPPTKAEPLPADIPHQPWPTWDVGWGELTHHGEQAITQLARLDKATYGSLVEGGCPAPGSVRAVSDTDQRTVRTAEVYVATMFAGCTVPVEHKEKDEVDPRFSPFAGAPLLPVDEALAAASAALPPGGVPALDRQVAPELQALDRIIACGSADCALADRPTMLTAPGGRIKLGGGVGLGSTIAEGLALEYADGKPLGEVGWGRADRATITALLALHATEFAITARPPAIAKAGAHALLGEVAHALTAPAAPRFSLFLGHDTNLALIGGALGLHWHVPQFAPDDPPPGGALIFERWRNAKGAYRLRVVYRSQTLDEMRDLSPLTAAAAMPVAFGACADGCKPEDWNRAIGALAP